MRFAGERQATILAAALATVPACAIYSSDLQRAISTAEAIAARQPAPLPLQLTPALRERALGHLQGLTPREAALQQPAAWEALHAHDPATVIPGGGESQIAMEQRVVACLKDIAKSHPGGTVIAVSHGGSLSVAHRHIMGCGYGESLRNCSINTIKVQGDAMAVVSWNDVRHLHEEGAEAGAFGGGNAG